MVNRWNPKGEFLDRPVPSGLTIDVDGLVESWIADAEDWMTAYAGMESLTSVEAFEGIEFLGRLKRIRTSLLTQNGGMIVIEKLEAILCDNAARFIEFASDVPNMNAWLEQATEAWDADSEDEGLAEILLSDLDSVEYLLWFAESHSIFVEDNRSLLAIETGLNECVIWVEDHREFFIMVEAYIRAVAIAISDDLNGVDPSARLALSSVKYATLLDTIEDAWEDTTHVPSLAFLEKSTPFGSSLRHYQGIPELAFAAGASESFTVPREPMKWRDPQGQLEATAYLPQHLLPSGQTPIELLLGTGPNMSQPATDLVGASVQLGGAKGIVKLGNVGELPLTVARLMFEMIATSDQSLVELFVNGVKWNQ